MTKYDFTKKLAQQFTFKTEALSDIGDYLSTYSDEDLSRLWTVFETEYLMVSAPRKGHLIKIAEAAKIFPKATGEEPRYVQVCYLCASQGKEHTFPLGVFPCPRCGTRFQPWLAVGYAGLRVNQERAALRIGNYPQGPDPRYGIKKPFKVTPDAIGAKMSTGFDNPAPKGVF